MSSNRPQTWLRLREPCGKRLATTTQQKDLSRGGKTTRGEPGGGKGQGWGIGLGQGRLGDKSSGESRHVFHSLGSTVPTKAQSSVLLQFKERRRKWWRRSVTPTLSAEGTSLRPVWAIKQDPVCLKIKHKNNLKKGKFPRGITCTKCLASCHHRGDVPSSPAVLAYWGAASGTKKPPCP